MIRFVRRLLVVPLALAIGAAAALGQSDDDPAKKFGDFNKITKGAKEHDGLFKLYQKDEHVYMEIRPDQFDRPFLTPISIVRGMGMGGHTLNFDEQWVLMFRRVGDRIHVIRKNVHFQAKAGSPVAKAVETTYTDSVIMALRIQSINPMKQAPLIDLNDIFFTDFGQIGLGFLDRDRTTWHKVKVFPKNVELQVAATFSGRGGRGMFASDDSVIDSRGTTVVIHYGFVGLPEFGYTPRVADDRVGYFLTAMKDFSTDNKETAFVRYINRWRLERADGSTWKEGGKLVPPKKKIVYWIESSVPIEYRAAVSDGILEWNKAFEKIGFRDAVEVRQQESEDFDPEDVTYNTFRWVANDQGYAMGPSRANPLTGELLDADIIFDASMVRYYKMEHPVFQTARGWEEPASLIQATQRGWGLPRPAFMSGQNWDDRSKMPSDPQEAARMRFHLFRNGLCQCGAHKRYELNLGVMAWMAKNPGEKVPDELIQQAVKETVMHEVGHTLGLRHNFKASTMLKNEQLHDAALTRKQGLVGSVMDYNPVNVAPKGVKQGDYFTNTIGPYDYWAIEYGYKPLAGGTDGEGEELGKIACKGATAGLDYGTDEDLYATPDPLINQWDLGADTMKYAQDRVALAEELMKGLADRVTEKGDGYQKSRMAFSRLLRVYGDGAYLVSRHVGGEHVNRDHKGDPNGRDPFVPVKASKQRDALKFVADNVLTDKPFTFPPELLRKLAADRWMHWGNEMAVMRGVEFPINERVLRIQQVALDELLDGGTLSRVQNLATKADKDEQPLQVAEIFRAASDAVWADLPNGDKASSLKSSVVRRNLQREYLKRLTDMVLGARSGGGFVFFLFGGGGEVPADAKSLARMHLKDAAKRIDAGLGNKSSPPDDTTRAHLEECKERIAKALAASMQVNE